MSTRGILGFRISETDKVSYNHSDSYPDGLGIQVLGFIREVDDVELKEIAERIELINEDIPPTAEQIKICKEAGTVDLNVSTRSEKDWYCLLRNAQGDLESYRKTAENPSPLPFMVDSSGFMTDSLFCEWGYIINIDTGNLEIYKGFNEDPEAPGRYASLRGGENSEYYGIKLILELPFNLARNITDEDFIAEAERKAEGDDGDDE
jgi:hypothetical protein